MTDRSDFTDEQWHALTDAPVAIMLAVAMVADHGPISMVKESTAGAKVMAMPPHSGPADELIAAIVPEAKDKQARHDAKQHKGATPNVVVDGLVADVEAASKALDHVPEGMRDDDAHKNCLAGIEATQRELEKVFGLHGITRIAAKGLPLDPNQHQAMLEVPTDEAEPGTVVQEMQSGYMIKDRLLRPAMFAVAKKPG